MKERQPGHSYDVLPLKHSLKSIRVSAWLYLSYFYKLGPLFSGFLIIWATYFKVLGSYS